MSNSPEDPDRATVEAFRRGDAAEAAFRRLVARHYQAVRRFFRRRGADPEAAADLTQETFLRVYQGLARFDARSRFDTWLYRVALNTLRKAIRHRAAQKRAAELPAAGRRDQETDAVADQADAGFDRHPLETLLERERQARLAAAVDALPPQMRACLALRVYQELSYRQIATAMNLSIDTVKSHLYQARRRLAADLHDADAGEEQR